jgi:cytochrome c oxidase cbb3-type subunit 4
MDTYSLLRQIADSWVLLAMFIFFAGVAVFAFLPSQRAAREDASMIPFRNDTIPEKTCKGTCKTCACKDSEFKLEGQADV